MAEPYIGEIRIFAGTYQPAGWLFCDGRPLQIAEYDTLFTLIGTTYGGDGETTFHLPDLRSRLPLHQRVDLTPETQYIIGETGGAEQVTLTVSNIPNHKHAATGAAVTGDQTSANGTLPANSVTITPYLNSSPDAAFNATAVGPTGGSQPHENRQPYLCVNFIISLFGIFPSQT